MDMMCTWRSSRLVTAVKPFLRRYCNVKVALSKMNPVFRIRICGSVAAKEEAANRPAFKASNHSSLSGEGRSA